MNLYDDQLDYAWHPKSYKSCFYHLDNDHDEDVHDIHMIEYALVSDVDW